MGKKKKKEGVEAYSSQISVKYDRIHCWTVLKFIVQCKEMCLLVLLRLQSVFLWSFSSIWNYLGYKQIDINGL